MHSCAYQKLPLNPGTSAKEDDVARVLCTIMMEMEKREKDDDKSKAWNMEPNNTLAKTN